MAFITTIFTDKAGQPMRLHGGEKGMDFGIDNIPRGCDKESALSHVFSSFASYDYSIGQIDFAQVTFKYTLDGKPVEQTFTKDEFKKKQQELFCSF